MEPTTDTDRRCWPVSVRLEGTRTFLAWVSADADHFLCRPDGRPLARPRLTDLSDAVVELGRALVDEPAQHINLDAIETALRRSGVPAKSVIDCWNFLTDLCATIGEPVTTLEGADTAEPRRVYNKVLCACNLPAMTPPGNRFRPRWAPDDLRTLKAIFRRGRALARRSLGVSRRQPPR
jgi:hypothetical protein